MGYRVHKDVRGTRESRHQRDELRIERLKAFIVGKFGTSLISFDFTKDTKEIPKLEETGTNSVISDSYHTSRTTLQLL